MLRILIVDDHQIALEGLTALLNASAEFEVAAALSSGEEAVEKYGSIRPDVTIMDLRLRGIDGIETIRRIRAVHSNAKFVIMTTFDGDENVYRALEAGASAYLLKDTLRQELFSAIRDVHAGRRHVTASVAAQMAENFPRVDLTPREQDVLRLMASGMRNKEIAGELEIAEHTVKVHVQNILGKLGVNDRTEAVVQAFKRGFLHLQ